MKTCEGFRMHTRVLRPRIGANQQLDQRIKISKKIGIQCKRYNGNQCVAFQVQYCCSPKKLFKQESGSSLDPNWKAAVNVACSATAPHNTANQFDTFVTQWIRIKSEDYQPGANIFHKGII